MYLTYPPFRAVSCRDLPYGPLQRSVKNFKHLTSSFLFQLSPSQVSKVKIEYCLCMLNCYSWLVGDHMSTITKTSGLSACGRSRICIAEYVIAFTSAP